MALKFWEPVKGQLLQVVALVDEYVWVREHTWVWQDCSFPKVYPPHQPTDIDGERAATRRFGHQCFSMDSEVAHVLPTNICDIAHLPGIWHGGLHN